MNFIKHVNKKLTLCAAYCAMIDYLDKYYFTTYSDDLGSLLDGMVFLADGKTVDSAAWEDWLDAINKVNPSYDTYNNIDIVLTINEAYVAMINFLENYACLTKSEDIRKLLDGRMQLKDGSPVDRENWNSWMASVEKILKQDPLILPLLELTK